MSLSDDIATVVKAIPVDDDAANEALLNVAAFATEYEQIAQRLPEALRVVDAANWLVQSRGARNEESSWRLLEEALSVYSRTV